MASRVPETHWPVERSPRSSFRFLALGCFLLCSCSQPHNPQTDQDSDLWSQDAAPMTEIARLHSELEEPESNASSDAESLGVDTPAADVAMRMGMPCNLVIQLFRDKDGDFFPAVPTRAVDRYLDCADDGLPDGWVPLGIWGWDCDDQNAAVFPTADETCDELDNDCDGQTDEGVKIISYYDGDEDGYGSSQSSATCEMPPGHVDNKFDCNDKDWSVYPSAPEICDKKDNDCDGETDEDLGMFFYQDMDQDGWGNILVSVFDCSPPWGYVEIPGDCDDLHKTVHPGAPEICDGLDNDCDGAIDENLDKTYYQDQDWDGWGNTLVSIIACSPPWGYVEIPGDCVDTDKNIHPGAEEICNGVDDDCDGIIDNDWGCCPVGSVDKILDCTSSAIVFVIDNSGSMTDNDPGDIRYLGLTGFLDGNGHHISGFVDLMSPDDSGIVVPFSGTATVVGAFTADHALLKSNISAAKDILDGGGTAIGNALVQHAIPLFENVTAEKIIILLTDGVTGDEDEYPPQEISALALDSGIALYAVGLGTDINPAYLAAVSNSKYVQADSTYDVPYIYGKIFAITNGATWMECSPDHEWVETTGMCTGTCANGMPPVLWFTDEDGDGFGAFASIESVVWACDAPQGMVADEGDCDDTDPQINSAAAEQDDWIDHNCNGEVWF